ncbi:MAG TPA: nicotinate-nucleotide--dimethylbenzimidazole phosphoribosyltransferase [Candidatus Binataceae bacterium]|nr:nicotinate-nucleotide--dimethylbenzimidazole phosphoribosyltransferase [Candidatus Binataceae bacterium]
MSLLDDTIDAIAPPDRTAREAASARLDALTKPPGSLGYLEEIVKRYVAIRRDASARFGGAALAVFAADHGVADAGVSAYPKAVTVEMLRNIGAGGAAISVLARSFGYQLVVTDVGVVSDTSMSPFSGVLYRRIGAGTRNFLLGPAMTPAEARRALEVGIEIAQKAAAGGATLLGIGEMGIANSTSAATILAGLVRIEPARIAGRGTGVDDAGFRRKISTIEAALRLHEDCFNDAVRTLAAVGGFEIGAMAGVCLGGAALGVPVVIDGFIATAAAVIAQNLRPGLYEHLFFAHRSAEGGHSLVLETIGVRTILDLGMRLGEGTGAALAMKVIESALTLFHQMATFESAGVSGKIE